MSCTCNNADPNCEPCAFCTPPGVKCLPDCNPEDPCPDPIDLCCVLHSGEDQPCSEIVHGEPLCDLLIKFLEVEFPDSECCILEMSIDLLSSTAVSTTTTTSSTTTSTTTTSSTTTSSTTTSSTTTTTTQASGTGIELCYTVSNLELSIICNCNQT